MRRIDVLSICIETKILILKEMEVSLWMTSFCAPIHSWRYRSISWLNWHMEAFFRKYFSFSLPYYVVFDWIDLWRFYSNNSWGLPWDGFVCKNIISFLKRDQEKNLRVGHIHMIRDNKRLVCPSTYLIHGSFPIFMVDNHHSHGFPYLLTISMFLIAIFPKKRIRVSKNVFPLPLPLPSMDLRQCFSCFNYQWYPSSF